VDSSTVASVANRPSSASKTATSQGLFLILPSSTRGQSFPFTSHKEIPRTDVHRYHYRHRPDHLSPDNYSPTTTPTTQTDRSAANRLRSILVPVRLAFIWLGTRKTLAPEQRDTAARAFHADRELLSATTLILDTKNPTCRAVAAVRSEASSSSSTVTLPP